MNSAAAGPSQRLRIVMLGLSITSSWGNGHATTYRSLVRALSRRGHEVLFLKRDMPWYRDHRDLPEPPFATTQLYDSVAELGRRWRRSLRDADLVILGSYVPDGIAVAKLIQRSARGLIAFYDIDTPVTLAAVAAGSCPYLTARLIPGFDPYLSLTGRPLLRHIEARYGVRMAQALYCSVDPDRHSPQAVAAEWVSYLGTYSADRQPLLSRLICDTGRRPAGRFAVAGSLYPSELLGQKMSSASSQGNMRRSTRGSILRST